MALQKCEPSELFEELEHRTQKYTIRAYQCTSCSDIWSEIVDRKENRKKKCPCCQKLTLESIIYDVPEIIDTTPRTVGTQAEKNQKKMGTYEYEEKARKLKEKANKGRKKLGMSEKPPEKWWGEGPKDLADYTPKQKEEYVRTGKKK